jgi:phosphoserine aminotransferase
LNIDFNADKKIFCRRPEISDKHERDDRMHNPNFSSGPCSKRPQWRLDALQDAAVGRSHRSALGKQKLAKAIAETKKILGIPDNYLVGVFPGSDTGAFEAAMWSFLGPKPVTKQLKLNPTILRAEYGMMPDLSAVNWNSDVVFVANGTTSGVKIPDWEWIPADRTGLSLCDATSAAFAMPIDWSKVDILSFSWQKCLGGEAAHGMLVLSPRAVARMESYDPPWPLPKVFRMKKGGTVDKSIFEGDTINTPSMLCVEDYLDALKWADAIGLEGLFKRSMANLSVIEDWVEKTDWIDFLAAARAIRSNTSVCLTVTSETVKAMPREDRAKFLKTIAGALDKTNVAHDINSYKDAPPGFRFWCGPTIEPADISTALAELEKIYQQKIAEL